MTPTKVRGEAFWHLSSSSLLNFTPPLTHKSVIKEGWGMFLIIYSLDSPKWTLRLFSPHSVSSLLPTHTKVMRGSISQLRLVGRLDY